jgi:elongation factor G
MQTYSADLRSMTQGRGVFSMVFQNYGRVPTHMQEKIAAEARARREEHAIH